MNNKYILFFEIIDCISKSEFYKKLTPELGYQHKLEHIYKVMFFSEIIANIEKIPQKEKRLLLIAAAFHDVGRTKDRDNGEHAKIGAEVLIKYVMENLDNPYNLTLEETRIVQSVIEYHVVNETEPRKT